MRGLEQIPWLYDACCALMERLGLREWRHSLAAGVRGRTLELGCGTGRNLPLYDGASRVIGVDPSADALRRAHARAPDVPLVQGSAAALPFRDGAFDTVVASLVLCSVPDPRRALAEARRVLRPGGEMRFLEHVRAMAPWRARLQDRVQPAWTRLTGGCHPNRDTERTVRDAGLSIDADTRRARGTMRRFDAR